MSGPKAQHNIFEKEVMLAPWWLHDVSIVSSQVYDEPDKHHDSAQTSQF